ncbi:MAG: dihydrolipoyllysine-residue acetyltransferase [Nevskiales bacterium]|nr:dihydrolipoyllysine-residue acetyltransferase [Nevskiales bacterium]
MSQLTEVKVPDLGDYQNVPVIEVLVKEGQRVEKDAALITLESEKATMEVPAPDAGVVRRIRIKVGDKISKGDTICELETTEGKKTGDGGRETGDGKAQKIPSPIQEEEVLSRVSRGTEVKPAAQAAGDRVPPWEVQAGQRLPHASPLLRKLARQFGVDLNAVQGTGSKGRITQEDVQGFVKQNLAGGGRREAGGGIPPISVVDFSQFGEIETRPLARIRKISAAHLHRAWLNVPHVTQHDEADITELEFFRKTQSQDRGVKLTLLPFLIKAVSLVLRQFPEFSASLAPDGESLILKKYCHIGFAADTPNGLVVPVIRDVDRKGLVQLARECGELAQKARDGKLKPDEMKGGCFSISSLGGIGGGYFTPIVNAPEVAILGASRAVTRPVWNGSAFTPRLLLPLSLSYDHRVIDGAAAARFIVYLGALLADVRRLAL